MQSHCSLNYPKIEDYRNSIEAFINTGVNVMITELDVSVLPELTDGAAIESNFNYNDDLNPYKDFLPEDIDKALAKRYADLFEVYNDYNTICDYITSQNAKQVGVYLGGDSYEYPIWKMLYDDVEIQHVKVDNILKKYEDTTSYPEYFIVSGEVEKGDY